MAQATNNDRIRAYVGGLLDNGADLTQKKNRDAAFDEFTKKNPDIAKASARASWSKIVPKLAAERGVDPETVKPKRSPKVKVNGRLISNLDPRPVDINPNYQQAQPQGGPVQPGVNWQQGQQQQQQFQQGAPFGGAQPQPGFRMDYTVASTGAFWDSFYNFLRMVMAPEAEGLSDQERTNLGETWVAPFNYYLAGKEKTAIAIALLGTMSIFATKMKPARDKAKKDKEARADIGELRKQAREAAQKMPKPEAPPEAEPDKPPEAKKEAPPGRYIDMKGMESESNE